jgi:hypothetical protein
MVWPLEGTKGFARFLTIVSAWAGQYLDLA